MFRVDPKRESYHRRELSHGIEVEIVDLFLPRPSEHIGRPKDDRLDSAYFGRYLHFSQQIIYVQTESKARGIIMYGQRGFRGLLIGHEVHWRNDQSQKYTHDFGSHGLR